MRKIFLLCTAMLTASAANAFYHKDSSGNCRDASLCKVGQPVLDYPQKDILDVIVDTSVKSFRANGYMTVLDGVRATIAHKAKEAASLGVDIEGLPVSMKKQLIQRCNFGKVCHVSMRGQRSSGGRVIIEDLQILGSRSVF